MCSGSQLYGTSERGLVERTKSLDASEVVKLRTVVVASPGASEKGAAAGTTGGTGAAANGGTGGAGGTGGTAPAGGGIGGTAAAGGTLAAILRGS